MTVPLLLAETGQQSPLWVYLVVLAAVGFLGLVVWLVDRFFPSTKNSTGTLGTALMRLEADFLSGREHVVEMLDRQANAAEEADQGNPPETGHK